VDVVDLEGDMQRKRCCREREVSVVYVEVNQV
jgi:hypothetical protein